jgi:hypothetical protein
VEYLSSLILVEDAETWQLLVALDQAVIVVDLARGELWS